VSLGTLMAMALSMRKSTMALATTWFGEDLAQSEKPRSESEGRTYRNANQAITLTGILINLR
jgi:hypothetical protein